MSSELDGLEEFIMADARRIYSDTVIEHAMTPRNAGIIHDADGTATLTMYESDGDIATATVTLTPHGMVVNLVNNLDWTVTDSSGSGAIGDARSYIDLSATVNVDGTAMITNASTGESISYLPRQEDDM